MAPIYVGNFGPEELGDTLRGGQRVFHDVVEQTSRHRHDVQFHVGQKIGDFERVHEVGLAGMTDLPLVFQGRKDVRPPKQLEVGLGAVAPHFLEQRLETNHRRRCLRYVSAKRNAAIPMIGVGLRGVKETAPECLTDWKTDHYTGPLGNFGGRSPAQTACQTRSRAKRWRA